jgi:tRNA 2-thiocytidine biosynthesis protein TtcA
MLAEIEKDHPFLKETLLSAMGKIEPGRLLDTRFLDLEQNSEDMGLAAEELIALESA